VNKKTIKISELGTDVPTDTGQAPGGYGLEDYDYSPLKQSLEDDGYDPDKHTHIQIKEDGTVLNGNRRTHLMQNALSLDQNAEIECEVKTHEEWIQDLKDVMALDPNMVATRDDDGKIIPAVTMTTNALLGSESKGYPNLVELHRRNPDIAGYDYDFVDSDGEAVDAGKSD
tara:strand:+ start:3434 stop:3946 length:513 start_codon:yes stop_codon:yes gene_type:complete